ncbi:hypothetical protein B0J13DRAFT_628567 [Dactylonectria estremocensis]|uniref:Peptidase metallopeptidase domain-containing protein n=1 Tax=Dactylonectria estremocensis TaxID=1079267 RepID=A0A9P9DRV7_9HYPO|nr:hypothetical protein B0J13DRAFT_628567 [Dactylonectria estremocensis]
MLAVQENPANGHLITEAAPGEEEEQGESHKAEDTNDIGRLAVETRKRWRNGKTLRVKFLNGSDRVRRKVRQYANIWTQYANINFQFVDAGEAEIRINFDLNFPDGGGFWSNFGTDSLGVAANRQTMNFGGFNDQTSEETFSSIVLHEFGHALGCHHEHQSPNAHIQWNEPFVIAEMWRTQNPRWVEAKTRFNIFNWYSEKDVKATQLDGRSIMAYHVPAEWTLNGFTMDSNTQLSETDKLFIARMYPGRALAIESFNTLELRPWNVNQQKASKQFYFSKTYKSPPAIAVGLTCIDASKDLNIRVRAFADNVVKSSAMFHLDTWADSRLYSASCMWFRKPTDDKAFQIGQFNTTQDHSWESPQAKTTHQVKFKHRYSKAPKVVVWLNELNLAKGKNWRVKAHASDVTATGFKLHVDSWSDTVLFTAGAAWIAYPEDRKGVASGTFQTQDVRKATEPRTLTSGWERFPAGMFKRNPKVVMGFNSIDADCGKNLRVKLGASAVSPRRMKWHINGWSDSILYSAGASYIVFNS